MTKLPDNERTLWAQAFVLSVEADAQADNPIFEIAPDSEPLTSDEKGQLDLYREKRKEIKGFNTLTVKKLPNGKWVARRATWNQQPWSSEKESLVEVFAKI